MDNQTKVPPPISQPNPTVISVIGGKIIGADLAEKVKESKSVVYESLPSRTAMRIIAGVTLLTLCVTLLCVVLGQKEDSITTTPFPTTTGAASALKNDYGMAFALEDAASTSSQKKAFLNGLPGEAALAGTTQTSTAAPETGAATNAPEEATTYAPTDDLKMEDQGNDGPNPTIIITDEEDKQSDNSENVNNESNNPRIVFIERLMGLHLTAPNPFGSKPRVAAGDSLKDSESIIDSANNEPSENGLEGMNNNPLEKLNARWAARMRKFSIPISMNDARSMSGPGMSRPQEEDEDDVPNPLMRYAAAAMLSRLLAAAARANHQELGIESMGGAKDKDDGAENDETVPVLLASVRSEANSRGPMMRGPMMAPPMYGRPLPRPMMSAAPRPLPVPLPQISPRPAMEPPMAQQRSFSMMPQSSQMNNLIMPQLVASLLPQLAQLSQLSQQQQQQEQQQQQGLMPISLDQMMARSSSHKPVLPVQPVLVMLQIPLHAAAPRQQEAESRMSGPIVMAASHPAQASQPSFIYPSMPQAFPNPGYNHYQRPVIPIEVPVPVPVPVAVSPNMMAHRAGPFMPQQQMEQQASSQVGRMAAAFSHARPVIEVPIEIPIPVQVPMPFHVHPGRGPQDAMERQQPQSMQERPDQDASASEDQVVIYYDSDGQSGADAEDQDAAESRDSPVMMMKVAPGPKHMSYLDQPFPANPSPSKMKLWREFVGAKHAAQPGVRYIPVAVSSEQEPQFKPHQYKQFRPIQMLQEQQQQQDQASDSESNADQAGESQSESHPNPQQILFMAQEAAAAASIVN